MDSSRGLRVREQEAVPFFKVSAALLIATFVFLEYCGQFRREAPDTFEGLPTDIKIDKEKSHEWEARIADFLKTYAAFKAGHAKNTEADAEDWAKAIVGACEMTGMPLKEDNLKLVLSVIEGESGFHVNPSLYEDMGKKYGRYMKEIDAKIAEYKLPKAIETKVKEWIGDFEKTHGRSIKNAKNEKDLDQELQKIREELYPILSPVKWLGQGNNQVNKLSNEIDQKLRVFTMGSMQVNTERAKEYYEYRYHKELSDEEIRNWLFSLKGGVEAGTALLSLSVKAYEFEEGKEKFVFADYHAGPFASRNAGFQKAIQTVAQKDLKKDGDLLIYEGTKIIPQKSTTEKEVWAWLKDEEGISHNENYAAYCYFTDGSRGIKCIRDMFSLEKTSLLRSTDVWQQVEKSLGQKITPQIPETAAGSAKLNREFTTETYVGQKMKSYQKINL